MWFDPLKRFEPFGTEVSPRKFFLAAAVCLSHALIWMAALWFLRDFDAGLVRMCWLLMGGSLFFSLSSLLLALHLRRLRRLTAQRGEERPSDSPKQAGRVEGEEEGTAEE